MLLLSDLNTEMFAQVAENWYVKSDSITIPDIEGRYALLAKSEAGFNFKALLIDCEHLVKVF